MGTPGKAGDLVMKLVEDAYEAKCRSEDQSTLPFMERGVFLNVIDREWQDYLRAMDDLRQGVNLRAYGQRDPLVEYKKEAFGMFETLMTSIKSKVISSEFRSATAARMQRMISAMERRRAVTNADAITVTDSEAADLRREQARQAPPAGAQPATVADVFASMMSQAGRRAAEARQTAAPAQRAAPAVGRNDPCPCGSGKKYKKCCGRNVA
jgi:preprotein translocase subunit SecA